jgi:nucleotide-binding universal stress UspA family protein
MFTTLVVALDLEPGGDRALDVVHTLADTGGLRIELVTVSSPNMPTAADAYELGRRADLLGAARTEWSIVHDVDVARGLLQHAARREAMLVMATAARRPWTSPALGSTARDVLRGTDRAVLLVGPNVHWTTHPPHTTLVPCSDADADLDAAAARAVPSIVEWHETFAGPHPRLAAVVGTDADPAEADARLGRLADLLAAQHVPTDRCVVRCDDTVRGLQELTADDVGPVYLTTSARYSDSRLHWHSTTQRLVHEATGPVLVVPARPAASSSRATAVAEHPTFDDLAVGPGIMSNSEYSAVRSVTAG